MNQTQEQARLVADGRMGQFLTLIQAELQVTERVLMRQTAMKKVTEIHAGQFSWKLTVEQAGYDELLKSSVRSRRRSRASSALK